MPKNGHYTRIFGIFAILFLILNGLKQFFEMLYIMNGLCSWSVVHPFRWPESSGNVRINLIKPQIKLNKGHHELQRLKRQRLKEQESYIFHTRQPGSHTTSDLVDVLISYKQYTAQGELWESNGQRSKV